MVQVTDARSGRPVTLRPHGGFVRVDVHALLPEGHLSMDDLRAFVVADVVRRALELDGLQVYPALATPRATAGQLKRLERTLTRYEVQPPAADRGGPADVHVSAAPPPSGATGIWMAVGPARRRTAVLAEFDRQEDPLAVRFALLAHPRTVRVDLSDWDLEEARLTLGSCRRQVTRWARSPSAPVPEPLRRDARAAIRADLDTPALIGLLGRVERDEHVPEGAKFEACAFLDRLLGVELTREVGRE